MEYFHIRIGRKGIGFLDAKRFPNLDITYYKLLACALH